MAEGYRFLADVLAGAISAMSETPSAAARAAGRDYGLQLVEREPKTPVPAEAVIDQVMTTFSELGFAPESVSGADSTQIRLHDCPFRELAKTRGDVVCSIHEGLLAGMLEAMGGQVCVDGLDPFVEPSLCIARVSTAASRPSAP